MQLPSINRRARGERLRGQRLESPHALIAVPTPFEQSPHYFAEHSNVVCAAHVASDAAACAAWLAGEVRARVYDEELAQAFDEDLQTLAAEGFSTEELQKIAAAPEPDSTVGDIGEAIADLFLIERSDAKLPSNRRRDLRSGKGSLPGADIVGFSLSGKNGVEFLFGEVKSSSQNVFPPGVMGSGPDAMPAQLARLATEVLAQKRLVMYLFARSSSPADRALYMEALKQFARGVFTLAGVLVRDTLPNQKDVTGPAQNLSAKLPSGRLVRLHVLHLSVNAEQWSTHCAPKVT